MNESAVSGKTRRDAEERLKVFHVEHLYFKVKSQIVRMNSVQRRTIMFVCVCWCGYVRDRENEKEREVRVGGRER